MTETGRSRIVIVRHGETEWSRSGQHTGSTDLSLTEEGRRKVRLLAPALRRFAFSRVFTSPLRRAVETCELVGLGDHAEPLEGLVEWDYGEYEGVTTADIRRTHPGWNLWKDGGPGGETAVQVAERADRVLSDLAGLEGSGHGDIALFGHGHFSVALCVRWIALPIEYGSGFTLDTASLSILGWHRSDPVIRLLNETSHLET